jgi:hypothetical protein
MNMLIDDDDRHLIEGRSVWVDAIGYATVCINGKQERLHRLIANTPKGKVTDHIDGNKLNNRRANLRVCDQAVNMQNVGPRKDNNSGVRGVWFDGYRGKWAAQITARNRRVSLGRFDKKEDAIAARHTAELTLWSGATPLERRPT